ncbi:MAG: type I-E CRISPR-associated protein Cas7/Cse4/CasC [Clostridiaceae bacterium]
MENKNIYLDIHAIQSVPPSNINRDDTGSPKTAQYGGVTRSRVSSQSWKKAMRDYFNNKVSNNDEIVGKRSLDIVRYVADEIVKLNNSITTEDAMTMADTTLNDAKVSTKDGKVKAMFFISRIQAQNLAKASIEGIKDRKELQAILNQNPSLDMALFGRMVADDASLNEDASCQVAHSISTHAVQTEFDFYTATDDLKPENESGAGMLGTVEFNSSTLYRYANIAIHELFKQLGNSQEFTVNSVKLFVEAFVKSMPTGKVNTFANQTLPSALVVTIREDRPVNLVTAFESPVKVNDGYVKGSIEKLKKEYTNVLTYVEDPKFTFTIGIEGIGDSQKKFNELLDNLGTSVQSLLK